MAFKVKKLESGKYGLYNTTKKEMSKREFLSKESADKMSAHYTNFSKMRKTKKEPKEEPKEEKEED